jgi:hypothetical protein
VNETTDTTAANTGFFCSARHPYRDDSYCRRSAGHEGDHSAYTGSIATPETWPDTPADVDIDWDYDDDDIDVYDYAEAQR